MSMSDTDAAFARLGDAIARYVRDPVGSVIVMQAAMVYARAREKQMDALWRAAAIAAAEAIKAMGGRL